MLTGYDGRTFTYDTIGNLTSDGERSYTWKHGRQLATLSDGTTTWQYTYNADGLRTKKTDGTTTYSYVYNGGQLTQMTVGTDTLYFSYDATGRPMTVTHNGTVYYYVLSLQGDVLLILDGNGGTAASYQYDAWGNTIAGYHSSTLGTLNPLRYRGYVYDTETELYYLQSRYYNPKIGRFISADGQISGIGGETLGYNQFAYCFNNPVNMSDSSGHWPKWLKAVCQVIEAGVQKVAATVGSIISNAKRKASQFAPKAKQAAKAVVNNTKISAGIGLGLRAEANVGDVVGLGLGITYNLVELNVDDAAISVDQSYSMGVDVSAGFFDFLPNAKESGSRKLTFSEQLGPFTPDEYEPNWTILSAEIYLIAGASIYIGLDVPTLSKEFDTIFFYE